MCKTELFSCEYHKVYSEYNKILDEYNIKMCSLWWLFLMMKSILVDKLNLSKYTIKFSEVVHFYYSYRNLICNFSEN